MKLMFLFFTLVFAGCVAFEPDVPYSAFAPKITPDGKKSFMFIGSNKMPSHWAGLNTTIEAIHKNQIANEVGQRQYCNNGYTIKITEKSAPNTEPNITMYEGVCK